MKKFSIILFASCLLAGCHLFEKDDTTSTTTTDNATSQMITSETTSSNNAESSTSSQEALSSVAQEPTEVTLFNETLSGNLSYPKTSVPLTISKEELIAAMEDYYTKEYTSTERHDYQQPIDNTTLEKVQHSFDEDATLDDLNAKVRQIQFDLAGDHIYVAQIIVPMSQQKAQQILKENDALLLNHTFAQLGNRLVMLAYYDDDTHTLLPVHLTNSSKPLFYYPES